MDSSGGGFGISVSLVVLIVLGVLAVLLLFKSIHVVPQASSAIVERFGRYIRTLHSGFHILVPFVDSVRNRIDLREQVVAFPPQPVATEENLLVDIDTVVYVQVTDARAVTYEVANYIQAIEQLVLVTMRNVVGGMDLVRTLASREEISAALHGNLDEATGRWGIRINRVHVKGIEPPASVRDAAGVRQSAILRAEGEKQAALLKAETERAVAAILDGDGDGDGGDHSVGGGGRHAGQRVPTPRAAADAQPVHEPLRKDDPRRIGRYQLTARLGQGGMGTVYLGRSPGERLVAVKVVQAELAADATFRQRFTREIEAARLVGGFHTAPVVDADPSGDPPWLATEYIPGPALHDVLRQHGALPVRTLHTLAAGVAEALEGIHGRGIIHRDLKPSNIIISGAGPRVIDFGIARAVDSTALTRTHHVVGTQGFLAPEQFTGAGVTPATDLYAFGMVLCHAAGAAPFADGEPLERALGLMPAFLQEIVKRCLDPDPTRRPTPTQVLEHLSRNASSSESWLPPYVRTMVDLHNDPTVTTPNRPAPRGRH